MNSSLLLQPQTRKKQTILYLKNPGILKWHKKYKKLADNGNDFEREL